MFKRCLYFCTIMATLLLFNDIHAIPAPSPEHQTFEISAKVTAPNTLLVNWDIKQGNFLYKDRFDVKVGIHQHLGPIRYPDTDVEKTYSNKKSYQVYRNNIAIPLAILNDKPGTYPITITHQGCADSGFCYPPTKTSFKVEVDNKGGMVKSTKITQLPPLPTSSNNKQKSTNKPHSPYDTLFENHNIFFIILSFYGFGLLLAFTPCVLPMVPVLSGIIVGQHKNISPKKALFLSISYVLGMSVTYAIVGIIIAALGQNLQAVFQSSITISFFAILFVILALSMFDFYNLALPQSWQAKLASSSNNQNNGAYIGAASMGALSTLILSPCVTAPLVGALSYIAKTSDLMVGGFSLLFLGFGMGTPLIIIGASAGKLLPKAGNWMNHIKHLFGVILLVIAISLAERIAPPALTMLCWSALLLICGVFLIALNKEVSNNHAIFGIGLGLLPLFYGFLILIGVALGNTSPYMPLKNSPKAEPVAMMNVTPTLIKPIIVSDLNKVNDILKSAKNNHKQVFIDFYADWCASCKELDNNVFTDPNIQRLLKNMIWLKVDVTKRNQDSQNLEKNFDVVAPPTMILLSPEGDEKSRLIGETTTDELLKELK